MEMLRDSMRIKFPFKFDNKKNGEKFKNEMKKKTRHDKLKALDVLG